MRRASAVILLPQYHFCFRLPACMGGLAPLAFALLLSYPVLPLTWQLSAAHAPVHELSHLHCLCCFPPQPIVSPRLQQFGCWCLGTLLQPTPIMIRCKSGRSSKKSLHGYSWQIKLLAQVSHALLQAEHVPHHLKRASIVLLAWLSVRQSPSHHPHLSQYGIALALQR